MGALFISYRRDDSMAPAGRIFDRLVQHFGLGNVFMDIDSIPIGVDFRRHIQDTLNRCDVMLTLIGERWLSAAAEGGRRLDDPGDFVRIEIETALTRGIPLIPVLIGRATMPNRADLPPSLGDLAFRNALRIDIGRDFHHHVDQLVAAAGQFVTSAAAPAGAAGERRRKQALAFMLGWYSRIALLPAHATPAVFANVSRCLEALEVQTEREVEWYLRDIARDGGTRAQQLAEFIMHELLMLHGRETAEAFVAATNLVLLTASHQYGRIPEPVRAEAAEAVRTLELPPALANVPSKDLREWLQRLVDHHTAAVTELRMAPASTGSAGRAPSERAAPASAAPRAAPVQPAPVQPPSSRVMPAGHAGDDGRRLEAVAFMLGWFCKVALLPAHATPASFANVSRSLAALGVQPEHEPQWYLRDPSADGGRRAQQFTEFIVHELLALHSRDVARNFATASNLVLVVAPHQSGAVPPAVRAKVVQMVQDLKMPPQLADVPDRELLVWLNRVVDHFQAIVTRG